MIDQHSNTTPAGRPALLLPYLRTAIVFVTLAILGGGLAFIGQTIVEKTSEIYARPTEDETCRPPLGEVILL